MAVKLHENSHPMMRTVQQFEERSTEKGFSSLIKDANKFAEELGITLKLNNPEASSGSTGDEDQGTAD